MSARFSWQFAPFSELSADALHRILALRADVFVVEQNCAYADPDAKDRVAYVLLAVLLGIGIHNFYAGYTTRGIIQLLVSILSCGILWFFMWIWAIIEACTVTQDANGVRFK